MRVKQCCCGCSLRTGSLILFWTSAFGGTLFSMSAFQGGNAFGGIIPLAVGICGIIGTEMKKPALLLPYVVTNVLGIISMGFLTLIAIFAWSIIASHLSAELSKYDTKNNVTQTWSAVTFSVVGFVIFFLCCIALSLYFTVVVYSFYCELREKVEGPQDGVVYHAPSDQTNAYLPQGNVGYPPQDNVGYPPQGVPPYNYSAYNQPSQATYPDQKGSLYPTAPNT